MTTDKKVNWLIFLVVVMIGLLAVLYFARVQPDHRNLGSIDRYLGPRDNADLATWPGGLRGYLKETARELRKVLTDMDCRIWMLGNHPTVQHDELPPRPAQCPPDGPGLVPKDPP